LTELKLASPTVHYKMVEISLIIGNKNIHLHYNKFKWEGNF